MKLLIALAVLVAAASAMRMTDEEVKPHFEAFKAQHGKTYADATEEAFRMKIFKDNLIKINQHNERHAKGEVTFTVGINQFADLHSHEVVERMNGLKPKTTKSLNVHYAPRLGWPQSKSVDWRTKGYVTPVKNQGQCGDCFAFSTTGSLEGQLFKKYGKLVSLSEQQITDCSTSRKYGNQGCNGGNMDSSFQYIKDVDGIDTEEYYPFMGKVGRCRYNKAHSAGVTTGYVDVNPTEKDLEHAVATVGPVSVGIDASNWSFQYYSGGVYNEPWCSSTSLDHAVLVVGYGSTSSSDYWIVKNSWGTSWGEEGYIKMARNQNNKCGIASMASYPTV